MNIDNLTLGEIKRINNLFNIDQIKELPCPFINKYVIIRTYSAGVHIGFLKAYQNKHVVLEQARRIWNWEGRFTLSKIATDGIDKGKLSTTVEGIFLTEVIEIVPFVDKIVERMRGWEEYKP